MLTPLIERRRLEQTIGPVSVTELRSICRRLLMLHRFGVLTADETLALVLGYETMKEVEHENVASAGA